MDPTPQMQPYLVSSPSFSPESVHSPLTPTGYATDPYWASPHWTNDAVSDDGRSPAIHDGALLSGDGPQRPYPTHESLDLGIPFGSMSIYAGPDQLTPLFDSDCKLPGDSPSIVVSSAFRNHEAKMFSPNYPPRPAALEYEYETDPSPESSALFSGTHPLPLTRPEPPRRVGPRSHTDTRLPRLAMPTGSSFLQPGPSPARRHSHGSATQTQPQRPRFAIGSYSPEQEALYSPSPSASSSGLSSSQEDRPTTTAPTTATAISPRSTTGPTGQPLASPANIHASMSRRKKEAKYFCEREGCGQSFTAHHNLKHHIRAHDNIRPYDCPYKELGCDYAAGTPTVMKRHKNRCEKRPENVAKLREREFKSRSRKGGAGRSRK
ncbi:C2H2-type domain-containing protein [Mycena chlorophos]|uniref:C2H2-type domain-containing protein n=1 Tax=Mycena chlorophos TaxID=658473 RepID=A0A8H6TH99_MYCCL|nr:C2H2-type domain-containing protein [Mycena chlorophos]